jgi:hypothetical protein
MPRSNDQVLLQTLLEQTRKEVAPELAASEYFQLYVLEQLLRDRGLSYAELQSGIVDGGGDGGIDALYTLVNGVLVTSTDDAIVAVPGSMIELIIVQSKYTGGFSESAIDRLIASMGDLLDLSTPLDSLGEVYNADLLNAVEAFRNAYIAIDQDAYSVWLALAIIPAVEQGPLLLLRGRNFVGLRALLASAFHECGQQGERGWCGLGGPVVLVGQVGDPIGVWRPMGLHVWSGRSRVRHDSPMPGCDQHERDALSRAMATPAAE